MHVHVKVMTIIDDDEDLPTTTQKWIAWMMRITYLIKPVKRNQVT